MKTVELDLSGMSCGHCVATVQSALLVVEGVQKADVSLADKRAVVQADDPVDVATLIAAVEQAGYGAALRGHH